MKIERVEQYHIRMKLKHPFETSFGRMEVYDKILLAVYAEGEVGWGESPVDDNPFYLDETIDTAWVIQQQFLIPMLLRATVEHATDLPAAFAAVRGHNMAKAGLESAVWDLEAKHAGRSLREMLGGVRDRVEVGVSMGIEATLDELLARVQAHVNEGYGRIKIKIKPGWDVEVIQAAREHFPSIKMMADANSAYTLGAAETLRALDGFNLLMIEQPLAYDDLLDHAALQRELRTPVCLDESITTVRRAQEALALESCRVINIKPARVGGPTNARAVHDLCQQQGIPVWCGGMLESGVGRAHNLALASLPNFTLPGDISATDRYWHEDIIDHLFTLNPDSTISLPDGPGIGVNVLPDRLRAATIRRGTFRAQ